MVNHDGTAESYQLSPTEIRFVKEWVVLVLVCSLLVLMIGYQLLARREAVLNDERNRLDIQAQVVEENLIRQLQGANSALAGVRYSMISAPARDGKESLTVWLKVLSDAMPGIRSVLVVDTAGVVTASDHGQLVGMNIHNSSTFQVSQAGGDLAAMYVSPPFRSVFGGYSITISKVMRGMDGQLAGAIVATLDPEYFDVLLGSVFYAPDMSVSLVHGDGKIFTTMPPNPSHLGQDAAGFGFVVPSDKTQSSSLQLNEGSQDGPEDDRLVAWRVIQPAEISMNKPLWVAVSRALPGVYAGWRAEVQVWVALTGLLGLGVAALLLYSQFRRTEKYQIEATTRKLREESATRFEFGLKGADLGLWDWDVASDQMVVSERERQMLGYNEQSALMIDGKAWRHLIPQEDLVHLQTSFDAFLQGNAPAYKVEHRLQHRDGRWLWVESHAMVMERDPQGKPSRVLGTHLDITERKRAQDALNESAQRLELAMKCGSIGLVDRTVATGELVLNDRACEILGLPADGKGLTYDAWQALVHPDDQAAISEAVSQARLDASKNFNTEYRIQHADGHYVWINMRAETVESDAKGYASRVMGTFRDISYQVEAQQQLKMANEQLLALSVTDALTGIGNRRLFDRELTTEWARATRQEQPLALLLIDIDYFKRYNDHYGHQLGDACLQQVAHVLADATQRATELLARYGGEEFVILMSHPSSAKAAETMAQRCIDRIAAAAIPHQTSGVAKTVTISIGVVWRLPKVGETAAEFVRAADEALYAAKAEGRARYKLAQT